MNGRDRARLLALVAAVSAIPVLLAIGGALEALGYLSPFLCLLILLVRGRYLGEEALRRVGSRHPQRRLPPRSQVAAPRPARARLARGGALIATSLAVRPPPARP